MTNLTDSQKQTRVTDKFLLGISRSFSETKSVGLYFELSQVEVEHIQLSGQYNGVVNHNLTMLTKWKQKKASSATVESAISLLREAEDGGVKVEWSFVESAVNKLFND